MSSSTMRTAEQTAAGFWLEIEPQIVVINSAAPASMSAPMVVELLPTCAATVEKGRFCSGVKRYWAEGAPFSLRSRRMGTSRHSCSPTA